MNENNILPNGWVVKRLGDFVIYQKGKKTKNVSNIKTKQYSIPYVNIKVFERNIVEEYTDGEGCVLCEDGDILMVWDGARAGFIGKAIQGALGSTLIKIHFPCIVLNYAYYYLLSKYKRINTKTKGTGIPHVDPDLLWNYEFPLPPLPEQHRIVAKIEELFSSLDKGIESLKTAQQQLKVYRQAVLKWAFEGKLTNKDVKEGELPEGWRIDIVKNIALSIQYGYTESSSNTNVGPKFLRITDIINNKVDWNSVPYCPISESEVEKYLLADGDLVFARTGATVGKSFLIKGDIPRSVFASYLIRLRFPKYILDKYVWYFFQSPYYWNQIVDKQIGTGQPNVNGTTLGKLEIIVAPLSEQQHIVSEIESRLSVCDKIEESITTSLQQAEALRQSILKKAFEGKLLSETELEECRNDPNWEPASVLLERIASAKLSIKKAERGKNKSEKASKKSSQS